MFFYRWYVLFRIILSELHQQAQRALSTGLAQAVDEGDFVATEAEVSKLSNVLRRETCRRELAPTGFWCRGVCGVSWKREVSSARFLPYSLCSSMPLSARHALFQMPSVTVEFKETVFSRCCHPGPHANHNLDHEAPRPNTSPTQPLTHPDPSSPQR